MKVIKTTNIEVSMMEQIEDHMKIHSISFAEFIRRAAANYLDHNQNVTNVSINDSEQDSTPEPIVQPIDDTPKPDKPVNGDFNWDGIKL